MKAAEILDQLANNSLEYITWYMSLGDSYFSSSTEECMRQFYILDDVCNALAAIKDPKTGEEFPIAKHYAQKFEQLYKLLEARVGVNKKK